jgi:FkbM family methyltransferase
MNAYYLLKNLISHPLNQNNKIAALRRFMKWQLGSYFLRHPVVYPFIGTTKLVIEKGMTGATGNVYNGLHEYAEMLFVLHFLKEGDKFVDVGANIGSYTVLASGNCNAFTTAFEPVPKTFQHLKRNVIVNNLQERVYLVNKAVAAEKKIVYFTDTLDAANHVVEHQNVQAVTTTEVECTTLDDVLTSVPALIKIDVEGFETEVINGAHRTFSSDVKALIIELNGSGKRYGYNEKDIHGRLLGYGFHPFTYDPFRRELTKSEGWGTHNTIYIKDFSFVIDRLKKADPVAVNGQYI